jgi:tetratricopeptide (TPR) repeat protein
MHIGSADQISQGIDYDEQGLEILRSLNDKPGIASALNILGELTRVLGDDAASKRYYEESLAVVKETGERWREAMLYSNLCYLACHGQDFELALQHIRKGFQLVQEINNEYWFAYLLGTAAGPAAGFGRWEDAARLLGASHGLYDKLGSMNQPADQVEHDRTEANIRRELGDQAFEATWKEGHEIPIDEMLSFVLNELGLES